MENRVAVLHPSVNCVERREISLDQLAPLIREVARVCRRSDEGGHLVAARSQSPNESAADKPGCPGYESSHLLHPLARQLCAGHTNVMARSGSGTLHVGDSRFDDWDVVRDFEDLPTAQAWCRHLTESGVEAVITADWPLDRFGRGDIALRVTPGGWSEAEEFLSGLEEDS
jgi:hypothetical protein